MPSSLAMLVGAISQELNTRVQLYPNLNTFNKRGLKMCEYWTTLLRPAYGKTLPPSGMSPGRKRLES